MSAPDMERPRGAGERARPDSNERTAGRDAGEHDSERFGSVIAASDFPGLVKRLNELRDANQSTRQDMETYLLKVIESPPPELAEEVARLRIAQPNLKEAIAALIDGSIGAYTDGHPSRAAAFGEGAAQPSSVLKNEPGGRAPRKNTVEMLVKAALERADLFHDRSLRPFVTFSKGTHRETWPTSAATVRAWLGAIAMHELTVSPISSLLDHAVAQLDAVAIHDAPELEVAVRIAWSRDSVIVDLADDEWRVVVITRDGWSVAPASSVPIRMIRTGSMLPLPVPVKSGSIAALRELVNVPDREDWTRVLGFLVGAFMPPPGTYPALSLAAARGSGKSTIARRLASLIDPRKAQLMSPPRDLRDFDVAAANRHVLVIDNVSSIPPMLSDRLCMALSGGGWVARELYTDADEVAIEMRVPVIFTSIGRVVVRDDLSDRTLGVACPPIQPEQRRGERGIEEEWRAAQPSILGALYDAVSCALRRVDEVLLPRRPRLADHAQWVEAASPALGIPAGNYVAAIEVAQARADEESLADDPVGAALVELADRRPSSKWNGTYVELEKLLINDSEKPDGWPKSARKMSAHFDRLAPALRRVGIVARVGSRSGHARRRTWIVETLERQAAPTAPTASREDRAEQADECGRSRPMSPADRTESTPDEASWESQANADDAVDADDLPEDSDAGETIEFDDYDGEAEPES